MPNYCVIENDKIINIVVADSEYAAEKGWIEYPPEAGIGWGYVNGQFIPPEIDIEFLWYTVKTNRDALLSESDIYVLPDRWSAMTPEKQQEWSAYRQALRDIPQTYTDPRDVVWPIKPT